MGETLGNTSGRYVRLEARLNPACFRVMVLGHRGGICFARTLDEVPADGGEHFPGGCYSGAMNPGEKSTPDRTTGYDHQGTWRQVLDVFDAHIVDHAGVLHVWEKGGYRVTHHPGYDDLAPIFYSDVLYDE